MSHRRSKLLRLLLPKLQRYRKDHRLIIGALAALLLLFTSLFYFLQRGRDLPATLVTNRVLLFVLWYVNVVLILTVLFVLLRNIFKLVIERRARILGSTFKIKLVATYVGLSLIPVLLLFGIATELLQGSIDRWFNTPLTPVLARGNAVSQGLYDQIEKTDLRDARRVLQEIQGIDLREARARPRLTRVFESLLPELGLDVLEVYEGTEFVHAVINPESGMADLPEPGRDLLEQAAAAGNASRVDSPPGIPGRLMLVAVTLPVPADAKGEKRAPSLPVIVVAGSRIDPELAAAREGLVRDYQTYRQLEVQKDDLRASHLLIFFMITLLILLASSWVGLYLARRVTVPIQALAEGTRRISGGDLAHRVDVQADDELGVLVDSFNGMTQELESNKAELERSNRELVSTNQNLAGERALLAAVLENVAAGVVSVDGNGRIFLCNGAALKMLRQSEAGVLGRRLDEAWDDPERAKLAALLASPTDGRGSREVQLLLGGESKTFEAKVTALTRGGAPEGKVLVLEDLTELIKAQQLAAWNEAARRIAHEIRNPLTPIRLSAERLLRKHRQNDPGIGEAIEQGAEIIIREVLTLQGMVDEFSRYARMPRPRPAPVDLSRLVSEALHLYRDLKPGVEVASEVDPALPPAWLDAEQIRRALINLLDNAVEATEAPGRVTVAARRVGVNGSQGHLEIQVADTGRGIPPEAKEKLFLPYYSTKGRGTGLGLAIVHRIIAEHHGTIRVEDNTPRGTVFTMELPAE
ncbi:MAG TPA: ATP-binding protein [Thermoanaerobaculia bacterium]|jgi:two-component system nitrogen regulation sensor histidine kinase NtrY|nr:ATP-binding protein [Thermoanaerobaculia bacterium]